MQIDSKTLLCRYQYDALNRLVANTPLAQADTRRFYLKDRLATEMQDAVQRSIMQHDDQLLAEQQRQSGTVESQLLATDKQRSVLNVLAAARRNPLAYTPYGHRHPQNGLLSLLDFNGERPDPVTGHYLLGNGYRAFNPVLMRFNSPDSWSPFGAGGLNAYAYCVGDPVNQSDKTGHIPNFLKPTLRNLGIIKKSIPARPSIVRVAPPITIEKKDGVYSLIGYHGTSEKHAQQMQITGPKAEFDTKPNLSFGSGFYTTTNVGKAQRYADFHSAKIFDRNPNGLLAAYVKNPSTKKPGENYRFIQKHDELVIKQSMYSEVMLVRFRADDYMPELDINQIFNIQKEAHSMRNS